MAYSIEDRKRIEHHICIELAKGRGLSRICAEDKGLPNYSTVMLWQLESSTLSDSFERAREAGAALLVDEIIDIADDASDDLYIATDPKTGKQFAKADGDTVKRAQLRIYAREKYAALIAPRKFGNRMDVTSGGKALPAPVQPNDNRLNALLVLAAQRAAAMTPKMIDVTPPALDDVMS